jgi:thiol-disulfide isomerase/thioredoxin
MRITTALLLTFFIASCAKKPQEPVVMPLQAGQYDTLISSFKGKKAVLVNVWATWCGPCVEEFPDLVKLARQFKNDVQVIFISADFPDQLPRVKAFLQQQGVDWPTYIKDDADEVFINALDTRWTGSIPVTVIYNRNGDKVHFEEGKGSFASFEKAILLALNQ